jgi:hypothetical protein
MRNPFAPPTAKVEDLRDDSAASVRKTLAATLGAAAAALVLAWMLVPLLAEALVRLVRSPAKVPDPPMLALDLLFSTAVWFAGSYVAGRIAAGRHWLAAVGVGMIGWLVYFIEVGGITGILSSEFPLWYELSPSHIGPAVVAGLLLSRRLAAKTARS